MSASSLRNGCKVGYSIFNGLLNNRRSIAESIATPMTRDGLRRHRPHHQHQQASAYFRFSNSSIFKRTRELEWPPPSLLSSSFSSSSSKIGLVGWYLGMVKARPVLTKSITSGFIYTAADLSSQAISQPTTESYDLVRTLRMAGYGLLILGPSLHFWFNLVSRILPKQDLITTFKKMFLGQAIYGPFMTVVFFSSNALLQGESSTEIIARLKRDVIPTMMSGVMYWPICDFITFKFFPVHLQPLVSNSFSYLWTIYLTYMASLEKASAS